MHSRLAIPYPVLKLFSKLEFPLSLSGLHVGAGVRNNPQVLEKTVRDYRVVGIRDSEVKAV